MLIVVVVVGGAAQWSDGRVYPSGPSALGNAAVAGGLEKPVWIKAIYPTIASAYGHATTYPGGAYREGLSSRWLTALGFRYLIEDLYTNEVRTALSPLRVGGGEARLYMRMHMQYQCMRLCMLVYGWGR
jgi:hypothetical protein